MVRAIKFAADSDDTLEILAVPFGGILGGRDTDGEYFSAATDLCLDWFQDSRPLLYDHGLDDGPGVAAIGRVDATSATKADDGWWVRAQLDKSSQYFAAIKELIEKQKLYASSGAMPHLVRRAKHGEILRWPWVELSLTPTPANLLAVVEPAAVEKHYKAAGLTFRYPPDDDDDEEEDAMPEPERPAVKAVWTAKYMNSLPDSSFLIVEDGGTKDGSGKTVPRSLRHFPVKDADGKVDLPHLRNALARIPQSTLSQALKDRALAAARRLAKANGVEVADDGKRARLPGGKALPAGAIPAAGDDGDAPEGSYEDLLQDLNRALNRRFGPAAPMFSPAGYAYTVATFGQGGHAGEAGYAVVKFCAYEDSDDDDQYYRVEYTVGDDLEPLLGAAAPLDLAYIPAKRAGDDLDGLPLALALEDAYRAVSVVEARTRGAREEATKAGRMLSAATRNRLRTLADGMRQHLADLDKMVEEATPPPAADGKALRLLELRTRTAALAARRVAR